MFKSGGAIDFGQSMLKAAHMAQQNGPMASADNPPPYIPPQNPWYQAPPPAYAPPPQGYYGWVPPTQHFPNQPPQNSVFMTDSPPPYPGIYAGANGYPNGGAGAGFGGHHQPQANGAWGFSQQPNAPPQHQDPKAAEAAQSAYYDPNRPQMAYVPPPAYYVSKTSDPRNQSS